MRTALAVIALVLWVGNASAAGGTTALRVVHRATPGTAQRTFTLRCNPAGGTVTKPAAACRRLVSAGRAIFAPTRPGTACSQVYGGPQVAIVTGTLEGRRVWASFRRRDGCQIARWNRLAFLLGV